MSNTILTSDVLANEALNVLSNEVVMAKNVNRRYDEKFGNENLQAGTSIRVRKPDRGTYRNGATLTPDDITEDYVNVTVSQGGSDCNFTTADLSLKITEFSERILAPRIVTIANEIDRQGMALYSQIYNQVGTPGTSPNSSSFFLEAGAKLDNNAAPRDGKRHAILSPRHNASTVGALQGLFNAQGRISEQYTKGLMGKDTLGLNFYQSQNTPSHTVGVLGGTPAMNGTTLSGATTIVTDGWTAAALARVKVGDVFTIANVYSVNPITGQNTGYLQDFTATAIGSSDGSGNMTISISPAIITSGKFATVNAVPANDALLTFTGTASTAYSTSLIYHEDAFIMAMADMYLPSGVDMAAKKSHEGMSIRLIRQYDTNNDKLPTRLDVMFGWAVARAEHACRVIG